MLTGTRLPLYVSASRPRYLGMDDVSPATDLSLREGRSVRTGAEPAGLRPGADVGRGEPSEALVEELARLLGEALALAYKRDTAAMVNTPAGNNHTGEADDVA